MDTIDIPPRRSFTNARRSEPITHERAREAALRLIHSHFGTQPHARMTIPLNLDDDDVVIMDYIEQQLLKDFVAVPSCLPASAFRTNAIASAPTERGVR